MAERIIELDNQIPFETEDETSGLLSSIIFAFPQTATVPGWWTPSRDTWLRGEWIKHDALKVAVSVFTDKINAIPMRIVAKDSRISTHQIDAETMQRVITHQSGLFRGFKTEIKKAVIDYLTQDNGCFIWVMGNGAGPLTGGSTGLYHLDAARCERTSNPQFPVKYYDSDGKVYSLHYTRVIYFSKNPSPIAEYNGVGHSPVSACLDARQELADISILSAESMGSRPRRRIVYVKKGATIDQMVNALSKAESKMDNAGLTHFAYTTVLAPKHAQQELELDSIDLTNSPDGFDRRDVTVIDMSTILSAFGLSPEDANLNYGITGQSGDADNVDRTGRGQGPNSFIEELKSQMEEKVLPRHLMAEFDSRDDDQDEQQAQIWERRSLARERDMSAGVTSPRVERQRMLRLGEIQEEEFEFEELQYGRLPNGTSVLSLFYNPTFTPLLASGVENPTIVSQHDAQTMIDTLDALKINAWGFLNNTRSRPAVMMGRAALSAIEMLRGEYQVKLDSEMGVELDVNGTSETEMA